MRHLRCTNARAHKSGGRQPAVVGKPDAVRRKSPTIRRRCDARTRAAGVSPPWSVNRTQCGENRPPFDDDATHEQERRASARRGTGNRICNGDRLFRTQHVRPGTVAFHPTAGLRQPLLVASADAVADVRFVSASPLPIPTAGLRQPLLVARRVFRAECDICDAQTHVHKSGGRQPAVVGKPNAVRRKSPTIRRRCDARTRAAGVSPPWYRKTHLQRRPTFPNPARSPRHGRFPSHGWLTPAAPGCERGCCC
jgi:hypothetical protein